MEDIFPRQAEDAGSLGGQVRIAFTIAREILLSATVMLVLLRRDLPRHSHTETCSQSGAGAGDLLATRPLYHTAPRRTTRSTLGSIAKRHLGRVVEGERESCASTRITPAGK